MNKLHNQPIAKVELVVTGETLIPDDVTAILAINPTRSFTKRDLVSNRNVEGKRPWGLWALEFVGTDVQDTAMRLLEALGASGEALRKVVDITGGKVSVAIWWEPPEGQGGFTVSSAALAQLCSLSTRVDFYFPG